jgi:hypothetical protein
LKEIPPPENIDIKPVQFKNALEKRSGFARVLENLETTGIRPELIPGLGFLEIQHFVLEFYLFVLEILVLSMYYQLGFKYFDLSQSLIIMFMLLLDLSTCMN